MSLGIFIPGRLKSERLPGKLILPLGETNLFELACKRLSSVEGVGRYALVGEEPLLEIAGRHPAIKTIKRDPETCHRDGPLTFIFKELKALPHEYLMFLNPCLYNLRPDTLQEAVSRFLASGADYATSVRRYHNWLWREGRPLVPIDYNRLSTKEIPPCYEAAHCFHIFNKALFFETGRMLNEALELIEVPMEQTLDVDTMEDYEYAKFFFERRQEKEVEACS